MLTDVYGKAAFDVSDNGSLVYVSGDGTAERSLGWVTRDGQMTELIEDTGVAAAVARWHTSGLHQRA